MHKISPEFGRPKIAFIEMWAFVWLVLLFSVTFQPFKFGAHQHVKTKRQCYHSDCEAADNGQWPICWSLSIMPPVVIQHEHKHTQRAATMTRLWHLHTRLTWNYDRKIWTLPLRPALLLSLPPKHTHTQTKPYVHKAMSTSSLQPAVVCTSVNTMHKTYDMTTW